ncbi:hypothetical protein AVEN_267276-1 [Araneus ventricosus]|uniref:Uncharacterized protein n=1 Tax=Araneus ventricosus TaxID=182803 RepID=A0A4Y2PM06_ARAVE|nr:hypothetical protein AVEN_267276-1 [Araneus ventricosus]
MLISLYIFNDCHLLASASELHVKVPSPKKELTPKESLDFVESLQIPSPSKELFSPEILDPTETIKIPSPKQKLKRSDYQLITLYKADDPVFEQYSGYDADISEDEDDAMSSSSSEYFTAEEDNTSSGSLMSDSEVDALESEMNRIFMDMQLLSRRLRQIPRDQNRTMKSDVGRFRRKFMHTDSKIKKMVCGGISIRSCSFTSTPLVF